MAKALRFHRPEQFSKPVQLRAVVVTSAAIVQLSDASAFAKLDRHFRVLVTVHPMTSEPSESMLRRNIDQRIIRRRIRI